MNERLPEFAKVSRLFLKFEKSIVFVIVNPFYFKSFVIGLGSADFYTIDPFSVGWFDNSFHI